MDRFKWVFGVAAIVAVGALAGCGGSDSSSTSTMPETNTTSSTTKAPATNQAPDNANSGSDTAAAVALFDSSGCSGCHTFKPANASGSVGPDLDTITMTEDQIKTQIENGGGPMPAFSSQLSSEQIDSLAKLISDSQQ